MISGRRMVQAFTAVAALTFASLSSLNAADGMVPSPLLVAPSLHVVGVPEASGKLLMVVNLTSKRTLELSAVDPVTRKIVWQLPYSDSGMTPGVYPFPDIADGVVADLDPIEGPTNPEVLVKGVAAATGRVKWVLQAPFVLYDTPLSCAGKDSFCLVGGNTAEEVLDVASATTGRLVATIWDIERAMDSNGLYQTSSSSPTFEQITTGGKVAWRRPVSAFFGPGFDPNAGWDFDLRGNLVVGTIGVKIQGLNDVTGQVGPDGATENLALSKTVGVVEKTGALAWRTPGMYQCGGTLSFLVPPVLCGLTGSEHNSTSTAPPTFQNVSVTLEGFNATTGSITWRRPVKDVQRFLLGANIPFLDGSHVVVDGPNGPKLLNVTNGTTGAPSKASVYWCEHLSTYKINPYPGDITNGVRAAAPVYNACGQSGTPENGVPLTQPSTVGITVAGTFVWTSSRGLEEVPKI